MNTDLILLRSRVVKAIRRFFDERAFEEMFTPRLVGLPGQEPYLEPMWTQIVEQNGNVHPAALITSPEYAMKKLLASGMDKIYDLGSCFRNGEPWDGTHDPEFLMLEWYRRDAGLEELLQDTEELVKSVIGQTQALVDRSAMHELTQLDFRRLTVAEAMKLYAHVDLDALLDNREAMVEVVQAKGHRVDEKDTWDDLFFKIFLTEVEPKLGFAEDGSAFQPTFLTHYPASMAALARKDAHDPRFALRTELYIGSLELANGFAELADPVEQRTRFEEEQALRQSLGKPIWPIDDVFIDCLPQMGDAAGIAFGVDRLVMLIAGVDSISEILPIPVRERFPR